MRKFVTLLAAAAFLAAPMSQSFAVAVVRAPLPMAGGSNTAGPWVIGCAAASAGSLMIGSAVMANDTDPAKRRELTPTEATWLASACPFLLPLAFVAQATCPDNKATYTIARLALRYVNKHPGASEQAFTEAYTEACQSGKLSRGTLRALRGLI